ncbi:MAG: hypothetical protein MJ072_01325, partial [Clostridia bacterium]|nr:hypothetical protein [Clostridia bacterium]
MPTVLSLVGGSVQTEVNDILGKLSSFSAPTYSLLEDKGNVGFKETTDLTKENLYVFDSATTSFVPHDASLPFNGAEVYYELCFELSELKKLSFVSGGEHL